MSDTGVRVAIGASLLWVVLATVAVLSTHRDVVAQSWSFDAPAVETLVETPAGKCS